MQELFSPRAHFRAFGFVVYRDALAPDELRALTEESDQRSATPPATGTWSTAASAASPATTSRPPASARRRASC